MPSVRFAVREERDVGDKNRGDIFSAPVTVVKGGFGVDGV